jgi:hypothetical protein
MLSYIAPRFKRHKFPAVLLRGRLDSAMFKTDFNTFLHNTMLLNINKLQISELCLSVPIPHSPLWKKYIRVLRVPPPRKIECTRIRTHPACSKAGIDIGTQLIDNTDRH